MPNTNINQDVVKFVSDSDSAFKEAKQLADLLVKEQEKVASLVQPLVGMLTEQGLITPSETKAASEKLTSHEGSLQVIQNLVTKLAGVRREYEQKAASNGSGRSVDSSHLPQQQKSAAAIDTNTGGVLGAPRRTGEKRASDHAFTNALGIN